MKHCSRDDIEYIRAMIMSAYGEPIMPGRSVFAVFSGKGRDQDSIDRALPKYRQHVPAEAENAPAMDLGGISATRVHATETRTKKSSTSPIGNARMNGKIRRAINSLPPIQHAWVVAVYHTSPSEKQAALARFGGMFWSHYRQHHLSDLTRATTGVLIQKMVIAQVRCLRSYRWFLAWDSAMPAEIRDIMSRQAWHKTYADHWSKINSEMHKIDDTAMLNVHSAIFGAGVGT